MCITKYNIVRIVDDYHIMKKIGRSGEFARTHPSVRLFSTTALTAYSLTINYVKVSTSILH
jgi:hypothetical protein